MAEAEAAKAKGLAEAEVAQARGIADAEVTQAKGLAEALAMAKKAEAWEKYNEAAILQIVIENLPALANAVAQPLSKTDKIVVIGGNGSGNGAGASKVTQDVVDVIAQLPPMINALTGVDIEQILKKVPDHMKEGALRNIAEGAAPVATDVVRDGSVPPQA